MRQTKSMRPSATTTVCARHMLGISLCLNLAFMVLHSPLGHSSGSRETMGLDGKVRISLRHFPADYVAGQSMPAGIDAHYRGEARNSTGWSRGGELYTQRTKKTHEAPVAANNSSLSAPMQWHGNTSNLQRSNEQTRPRDNELTRGLDEGENRDVHRGTQNNINSSAEQNANPIGKEVKDQDANSISELDRDAEVSTNVAVIGYRLFPAKFGPASTAKPKTW